MFPAPPPKYEDAFPHERPGQIEELLRENDDEDMDECGDGGDEHSPAGLSNDEDDASSASYRPTSSHNNNNNNPKSAPQPISILGNRESKYVCDWWV